MRGLSILTAGLLMITVITPLGEAGLGETDDGIVVVWTQDEGAVLDAGAVVVKDYGAFILADAHAQARALLGQQFHVEEVPTTIQKGTVSFDTRDGDAELPPGLMAQVDDPYQVIQFKGPIHREWLSWLQEQGDVLDYVPHNAFIVRVQPGAMEALGSHDAVGFVGAFHPGYKLHHAIPDQGFLTVDLQLWQGGDVEATIEEIQNMGAQLQVTAIEGIEPYLRVELDAALIEQLAQVRDVAWIEPVFEGDPLDNAEAAWVTQSGNPENGGGALINDLLRGNTHQGRSVHEAGLTGVGQVVAVADGGLDNSGGAFIHEMFHDPNHGPYRFGQVNPDHRKVRAYYALTEDGIERGDFAGHEHGVHTSGSAVGDAPEGGLYGTYNQHDGQAFGARLVKMDMHRQGDHNFQLPMDYHNVFHPTYEAGARLHSNSYGYPHDNSYNLRARQNDLFMHEHPDFLVFRSMGNMATELMRPEAAAKNVVGSGATGNAEEYMGVATFSSRGPTTDGRVKPTVVAPGQELVSGLLDNTYGSRSGTSMSTPTTAGAAALVREYFESGWYPDGIAWSSPGFNPSAALVRGVLINSAVPIYGSNTDRPGLGGEPFGNPVLVPNWPNGDMGWGIVRLHNTLMFEGDEHGVWVVDGDSVGTGGSINYSVQVDESALGLKVTLSWTDAPGVVGADPAIVNDLDLQVTTPDGTMLQGNVFAGVPATLPNILGLTPPLEGEARHPWEPFSTPGEPDRRNVEEQVVFPVALPGEYTITVTGANVPTGDQAFALIVSGGI